MDVLIRNALVVTQNAKREVKKTDVLVSGNKIARVGKIGKAGETGKKAGAGKDGFEVIDATGKLLMPGLINSHCHASMSLLRGYADDMVLHKWLSECIWPIEKKFSPSDVKIGASLACAEMLCAGITSFADMYFNMDSVAEAVEETGMRALLAYGMFDNGKREKMEEEFGVTMDFVAKNSGKAGGRVTCAIGPHAPYTCSDELLLRAKKLADEKNLPLHIHLSETRGEVARIQEAKGKLPMEYLADIGFLGPNVLAAHCVWLTKREVSILAKHGVKVSHNPISNMKLASGGESPVPEMLEAGVCVSLGTDGPASNNSLDMFETMKSCALLHKHARWDPTIVNAQTALDFATINGAKALGINAGSVEEGKLADLIMLDLNAPNLCPLHNPISHIVYAAKPGNVCDVMVDGKFVIRERKPITFDSKRITEKAQKAADALVSK
ncbi:MAG: amidohydrolase [Candidatus Micrarchaeota archaeon]|nr:amidohydrolase [Candidatus Micrarchaeota archaeon]